ncbi:MAG: PucR family transcriptional regulator [Frankiales bacterium]|nr:PucR family transcriptional regulator [Frankiales bacterium]
MAVSTPWSSLPPDMGAKVRPYLSDVVDEVIASIPSEVPSYARPLEGRFGQGVRMGVEVALGRFLDLPGTESPALAPDERGLYLALGKGELLQGRSLEALLAAYRVGARVAFRRFAALAGQIDPALLMPLAESVFAYIDELSAVSAEGYAAEQSRRAGESDRRRSELLTLLLSGSADAPSVTAAAAAAGWTVPAEVLVLVVEEERGGGLSTRLGPDSLVAPYGGEVVALVPASRKRESLRGSLTGWRAGVGPARPWGAVPASLRLAQQAAGLLARGLVEGDPVFADEHLADLVVHRDPELVASLAAVRLGPLEELRDSSRERFAETLLAWLQHRGERQHVAAALHVHPQTVGYRLGKLREMFGAVLDDPQGRFELELALRGQLSRR